MSGSAVAGYSRVNTVAEVQTEDVLPPIARRWMPFCLTDIAVSTAAASRAAVARSYTSPGEDGTDETGRPGPVGDLSVRTPTDIVWHTATGHAPGHDAHAYATTSSNAAADRHVARRRHLHGWRRHESR